MNLYCFMFYGNATIQNSKILLPFQLLIKALVLVIGKDRYSNEYYADLMMSEFAVLCLCEESEHYEDKTFSAEF
jgi:hypothetical protein